MRQQPVGLQSACLVGLGKAGAVCVHRLQNRRRTPAAAGLAQPQLHLVVAPPLLSQLVCPADGCRKGVKRERQGLLSRRQKVAARNLAGTAGPATAGGPAAGLKHTQGMSIGYSRPAARSKHAQQGRPVLLAKEMARPKDQKPAACPACHAHLISDTGSPVQAASAWECGNCVWSGHANAAMPAVAFTQLGKGCYEANQFISGARRPDLGLKVGLFHEMTGWRSWPYPSRTRKEAGSQCPWPYNP